MSYCRWSSDNWKCDLYCYADVSGGYTTHVAGRKRVNVEECPKADLLALAEGKLTPQEFQVQYDAQQAWLDKSELAPIGLPHDGQSFNDPDLESFLGRVLELKAMGYNVPDYVAESIREEIAEERSAPHDIGGVDG